jgi:hypothetical protein
MLSRASLTGHDFLHFLTRRPAHAYVSWSGSHITSRLLTACCRMCGSQVTNKQMDPNPLLLEPSGCNKESAHSDTLSVFLPNFLHLQLWLCIRVFCNRMVFCACVLTFCNKNTSNTVVGRFCTVICLVGQYNN